MVVLLSQVAGMAPDDCSLSGLCALLRPEPAVAPGVMFAAVALVALGMFGFLRIRDRRSGTGEPPLDPPASS